ncbi:hypothetical protein RND71_035605 [Anisodus tanguticus]|uniref:Uncharacterized protein n=1 Tax=Anisodus tanguticus TaxID=243964 RepID=A0AAE1V1Q3_9SOLA|nr:hypothetical protein RND71_035605 [Anisodus tanguticus]
MRDMVSQCRESLSLHHSRQLLYGMRQQEEERREKEKYGQIVTDDEGDKSDREKRETQPLPPNKRKCSTSEGPGSSKRQKVVFSEKKKKETLRSQRVLLWRVFDSDNADRFDMKEILEIVAEFYANLCYTDNCTLVLSVNGIDFKLDELKLGEILEVSTDGMKAVSGEASNAFKNVFVKRKGSATRARLFKKELKPKYQLLFALVNNVVLPRDE